ncbi:copper resistance protein CopC [Mycolicibacterium sp. Y3]
MKTPVKLVTATVLALVATVGPPPTSIHGVRMATDPPKDSLLSTAPQRISATFNERLQARFSEMTVFGPDGSLWAHDGAKVDGSVISLDLPPLGPAGIYTVDYQVNTEAGHIAKGTWQFRTAVSEEGKPLASNATQHGSSDEIPVWPFFVLAVAVVIAAAWRNLLRLRARTDPSGSPQIPD